MVEILTYEKAARDIVEFIARAEQDPCTVDESRIMTLEAVKAMHLSVYEKGGYMALCFFSVALTEMRATLAAAQGNDKILIQQVMEAMIGSFGKTVQ